MKMRTLGSDIVDKGKVKQSKKGMIKRFLWNSTHICTHKNRTNVCPQHKHGFTLIELVVVVAIISILAAMLLPALRAARGKAYQIACVGNLKQMHKALLMYANNHDGYLPVPGTTYVGYIWTAAMRDTIGEHPSGKHHYWHHCPQVWASGSKYNLANGRGPGDSGVYSYGMNSYLDSKEGSGIGGTHIRVIRIKTPSTTPLLGCMQESNGLYRPFDERIRTGTCIGRSYTGTRHSEGANIVFIDGHVEWLTPEQANNCDWQPW